MGCTPFLAHHGPKNSLRFSAHKVDSKKIGANTAPKKLPTAIFACPSFANKIISASLKLSAKEWSSPVARTSVRFVYEPRRQKRELGISLSIITKLLIGPLRSKICSSFSCITFVILYNFIYFSNCIFSYITLIKTWRFFLSFSNINVSKKIEQSITILGYKSKVKKESKTLFFYLFEVLSLCQSFILKLSDNFLSCQNLVGNVAVVCQGSLVGFFTWSTDSIVNNNDIVA